MLMMLGGDDPNVRMLAATVDTGLKSAMITAGLASGAYTGGWGTVATLGVIFINYVSTISNMSENEHADTLLILEAIRSVREDIKHLQLDMLTQFDRMRDQLKMVLQITNTRFDAIEMHLEYYHRDLRELMVSNAFAVGLLDRKLDRVRRDVYKAVSAQSERELRPLHLQIDWDKGLMDQTTFLKTMDRLWTAGIQDSKDVLEIGPDPAIGTGTDRQTAALYREMKSLLVDADDWDRLGALRGVAPLFGHRLGGGRLSSPKLRSLAANDYMALAQKWPEMYLRYDKDLARLGAPLSHLVMTFVRHSHS